MNEDEVQGDPALEKRALSEQAKMQDCGKTSFRQAPLYIADPMTPELSRTDYHRQRALRAAESMMKSKPSKRVRPVVVGPDLEFDGKAEQSYLHGIESSSSALSKRSKMKRRKLEGEENTSAKIWNRASTEQAASNTNKRSYSTLSSPSNFSDSEFSLSSSSDSEFSTSPSDSEFSLSSSSDDALSLSSDDSQTSKEIDHPSKPLTCFEDLDVFKPETNMCLSDYLSKEKPSANEEDSKSFLQSFEKMESIWPYRTRSPSVDLDFGNNELTLQSFLGNQPSSLSSAKFMPDLSNGQKRRIWSKSDSRALFPLDLDSPVANSSKEAVEAQSFLNDFPNANVRSSIGERETSSR